ncbi:hypothetical protein SteCoe_29002 [Stentor coeruleus]|uniref:SAM-dependent MTase RsmB/NOP-type domain-containing protein n=1 Tax=Stentor coeruleus TaxID=5963 RepID=A0A1R2B7E0_9CILI|nr:hypothetical protein SteCoe_29002 [Stentor coeruleus]
MLHDYWTTGKISGGGSLKKFIIENFPKKTLQPQANSQIWVRTNTFNPPPSSLELLNPDKLIENLYLVPRTPQITQFINKGKLIAQSKPSCMPVECLNFYKGNYNVIDTCAAPGNKTLQLAEKIAKFSTGKVFAYEKDSKRYDLLRNRMKLFKAENVVARNIDFFDVEKFDNVQIGVVDPSCSGSGIIEHQLADHGKLHNNTSYSDYRIKQLSLFQQKILSKVLSIPTIKQVVYSTCSVYEEENENVIKKVLKKYWRKFHLQKILKSWKQRGIGEYGDYMVRSVTSNQNTQGFFVAKLQRRALRLKHKLHKRTFLYWKTKRTATFI